MLRNRQRFHAIRKYVLLNEVLSLNAQEWSPTDCIPCPASVLNEVLSLNAQELPLAQVYDPDADPQ